MISRMRLDAGVYWNLIGGLVPAITALVTVSLLAWQLPSEAFLVVSLMLSICLFLQVFDFGFSRVQHHFQKQFADDSAQLRFFSTSLGLSIIVGAILTVISLTLVPLFVTHWLLDETAKSNLDEIRLAFQVVVLSVLPSIMMQVYRGQMEAQGAFKEVNTAKVISILGLFILTLFVALFSVSLVTVAVAIVLSRGLGLWSYVHLAGGSRLGMQLVKKFDYQLTKRLISHTSLAAIAGFISAGFIYGDRFFVAGYIEASEYTIYVLSQDFLSRYLLVPWSLAMVLVPYLNAQGGVGVSSNRVHIRRTYLQTFFLSLAFAVVSCLVIEWLLPEFFEEKHLLEIQHTALVILIGVVVGAFAQIPMVGLFTLGKVRLLCGIYLFELAVYLSFAPWALSQWGFSAAAFIWSGRLLLETILLNYFFIKVLKHS